MSDQPSVKDLALELLGLSALVESSIDFLIVSHLMNVSPEVAKVLERSLERWTDKERCRWLRAAVSDAGLADVPVDAITTVFAEAQEIRHLLAHSPGARELWDGTLSVATGARRAARQGPFTVRQLTAECDRLRWVSEWLTNAVMRTTPVVSVLDGKRVWPDSLPNLRPPARTSGNDEKPPWAHSGE